MTDQQLTRLLQQHLPVVPLDKDPEVVARLDARLARLEAELAARPPPRPWPWKTIAIGAAVLVAILVGLWIQFGQSESETPPPQPPPPAEQPIDSPPEGVPLHAGEE